MKKYVYSLNVPNSGSKIRYIKINEKPTLENVESSEFKENSKGCVFGIGNSPKEAYKEAERKLRLITDALSPIWNQLLK